MKIPEEFNISEGCDIFEEYNVSRKKSLIEIKLILLWIDIVWTHMVQSSQ